MRARFCRQMLELSFEPASLWLFLPVIAVIVILLYYRKRIRNIFWLLPLLLLAGLSGPELSYTVEKNSQNILYIDRSFSMQYAVNLSEKINELISRYDIRETRDFSGLPVEISEVSERHPYYRRLPAEKGIYLTDRSHAMHRAASTVDLKLPAEFIFDFDTGPACYAEQKCSFSVSFFTEKKTLFEVKAFLKNRPVTLYRQNFGAGFHEFSAEFRLPRSFTPAFYRLEAALDGSEEMAARVRAVLSVRAGMPRGYVSFEEINYTSWRISYALKDLPYWLLSAHGAYKAGEYDFRIIQTSRLPVRLSPDTLYILTSDQILNGSGWQKQGNLYRKQKSYLTRFRVPTHENEIFYRVDDFRQAAAEFSTVLESKRPLLDGGVIEAGKPFSFYGQSPPVSAVTGRRIGLLPGQKKAIAYRTGLYETGQGSFYVGLQREERSSLETAYRLKTGGTAAETAGLSDPAGLQTGDGRGIEKVSFGIGVNPVSQTAQTVYLLIVFAFLVYIWYSGKTVEA